jgi:uroporphyrin-3 C-methyltransferase
MHTIDRIVNDAPLIEPISPAVSAAIAPPARRWPVIVSVLLALGLLVSLALGWNNQQRLKRMEPELVRRQQDSQTQASEARLLSKRAEESSRESAAKVSLLEARLAEVSMQRSQLEDLIQSLSRSRDENVLVDIDAGLRVAQQQSIITGSAEPLIAALKQADDRLTRYSQPRLEGVRRAIARDIDRVKSVGVPDVSALTIKLDEAIRLVDELPMLSKAEPRKEATRVAAAPLKAASPSASSASAAQSSNASAGLSMDSWRGWLSGLSERWSSVTDSAAAEARSLVRVTRIEHPDAMMVAPEQAFFLRENLKLRLLNARLALLSRQFDTVQSDLQLTQTSLERYFDRSSRRTTVATDIIKQVIAGARHVGLPRPDETLAALAAANAGR